jgi:twitching motility protein PilI
MTADSTLFEVVHGFAQRFDQESMPIPAQESFASLVRALCFSVLDVDLAIPLDQLSEVLEVPEYTRLPLVKPWLSGIASIRGKLVPLIDFAVFLGGQLSAIPITQRVLVIDIAGNDIGLVVDLVVGVKQFDTKKYSGDQSGLYSSLQRYVPGCFVEDDGKQTYLLSPERFITEKSFEDMAL